ncbi:MAG: hypothetical protein AB7T49_10800 [Oligoflexales bacterium]
MKVPSILISLLLGFGVTFAVYGENKTETVHEERFTTEINIDQVISCYYLPPGDFNLEGYIVNFDETKIDFGNVDLNRQLRLYGSSYSIDVLPRGKDCGILEELRALSNNGILKVEGTKTIVKEVYGTNKCEKRFIARVALQLPLDIELDESHWMQLETGLDACDLNSPLKETGLVKFHLQAWSQMGLHCARINEEGYKLELEPATSELSFPRTLVSEETFNSEESCELMRGTFLATSRRLDPQNNGESFQATRSIQDQEVNGVRLKTQELKVQIYDLTFIGVDYLVIK